MKSLLLIISLLLSITVLAQDSQRARAEALLSIAFNKDREGASIEEVSQLIRNVVEIDSTFSVGYMGWGYILLKQAEEENNDELRKESLKKFEKALEINPKEKGAYYIWGTTLAQYAESMNDTSLYAQAFEKFEKAIEIDPKFTDVYISWGMALRQLAEKENNNLYYTKSIEKYNEAIKLNFNALSAYNGKGYSYLQLGKAEKNLLKYKTEIESSFLKAESLQSQSAAYNLACYYSLIKEKEKAFYWLEKTLNRNYAIRMNVLDKERIKEDSDFDNIRKDKRYKEIMNIYFKQ